MIILICYAQPTTLSHYLNTFIEPIKRDLTRISAVYKNLDVSLGGQEGKWN